MLTNATHLLLATVFGLALSLSMTPSAEACGGGHGDPGHAGHKGGHHGHRNAHHAGNAHHANGHRCAHAGAHANANAFARAGAGGWGGVRWYAPGTAPAVRPTTTTVPYPYEAPHGGPPCDNNL